MTLYLVRPTSGDLAIEIGSTFSVSYSGKIIATEGQIGALYLSKGVLHTKDNHTIITDDGISAKSFTIIEDEEEEEIATLGCFEGSTGDDTTNVVGIHSEEASLVLESVGDNADNKNGNIRVSSKNGDIYISAPNGRIILTYQKEILDSEGNPTGEYKE